MATTSKQATSKQAASTSTKQATSKKSSSKKATSKTTTKRTTAKKAPARGTSRKQPTIHRRDPQVLVEDVGYAAAGVVNDAVTRARRLPERVESLRGEVGKAAKSAPTRLKDLRSEVPDRVEGTVKGTRQRIEQDLQQVLISVEKQLDGKAAEGRKIAEAWRQDQRLQRILEQTGNTRSQLKGALTSVVRTGTAAAEAGRDQADTAGSQVKAAATSARKSVETVAEAATEDDAEGETGASRSTSSSASSSGTSSSGSTGTSRSS